jgi:hypothetical protein
VMYLSGSSQRGESQRLNLGSDAPVQHDSARFGGQRGSYWIDGSEETAETVRKVSDVSRDEIPHPSAWRASSGCTESSFVSQAVIVRGGTLFYGCNLERSLQDISEMQDASLKEDRCYSFLPT